MGGDPLPEAFCGARFLIAPGHFDFFGGAERQSVLLAKSLVQDYDCQVDFLGWGGDGVLAEEVRAIGCRPIVFPLDTGQRGLRFATRMLKLARFIRTEIQPQYLLPFVGTHCKVIGSIWRQTGARFCWWNQRDEGRLIYGTRRERKLLQTLPAVVSNSYEGRDFLIRKFGLNHDRVKVINNGIVIPESATNSAWRNANGIDANDILFAMVANLSQYKDHETLLRAFAIVRSSAVGKTCRLVLAGRHDEMTLQLKALAFDLNLSAAVQFPGALSPGDVQSLLSSTDVVVHSSIKEGCPNGALEAMARGLCVLGTDISGMQQALGMEVGNACLAPAGDADRLASLMMEVASCPEKRAELGRGNLARIRSDFSVERMTRSVLETVLAHRVA